MIVLRLFASLSKIILCYFGKGHRRLWEPVDGASPGAQSACSISCWALGEGTSVLLSSWGHGCTYRSSGHDTEEQRQAFSQRRDPLPAQCDVHTKCKVIFLPHSIMGRKRACFQLWLAVEIKCFFGEEVVWLCAEHPSDGWYSEKRGCDSSHAYRDNKGFLLPCLSSLLWQHLHISFLRLRSFMLE